MDGVARPDTFELRALSPDSTGIQPPISVANGEDDITILTENRIVLSV